MDIVADIEDKVVEAVKALYDLELTPDQVNLSPTRKEFTGDYTLVVFPFTKAARKAPPQIGEELGGYLVDHLDQVVGYNVIKGFLNLELDNEFWKNFLLEIADRKKYGHATAKGEKVLVEFSSPNTNKPLHLGHIRNILLGWSTSRILEAAGYEVVKVQIVNDRGIAVCKSMLAWQKFSGGETPESSGMKSDHFVGKYYVLFEEKFQEEYRDWQKSGAGQKAFAERKDQKQDEAAFFKAYKNEYFNHHSSLGAEAKEMLRKWEQQDSDTIALWEKMNGWVYAGFNATYESLGVEFDKLYYESDTYLLGKDSIEAGLKKDLFYRKEDGSVWIDLTDAKLDHKLVLRSDGTSVYMTQDIGTAQLRNRDFGVDKMVYVVGDEQNYHFQVLFEILKRLGEPYADGLYHLSYGMVDLPTGRMKSREGTVVDADDLIAEVITEAWASSEERGTLEGMTEEERDQIIRQIGLAALKFFIIKVQPQKRMTFNPKESVDMQGQTGPYIQNAYVRIRSVLRKAGEADLSAACEYQELAPAEKELITALYTYPELIQTAADTYDPSLIANFAYNLAKGYHKFYTDHSILKAESEAARSFRLVLSKTVAQVLHTALDLLGIEAPEKM